MLTVGQLESANITIETSFIELRKLLSEIISSLSCHSNSAKISVKVDNELPVKIQTGILEYKKALLLLINHAIKTFKVHFAYLE